MMKKILIIILCLICSLVVCRASERIDIEASGAVLIEKNSRRVLYEKNKDERFLTASIAKILTAITVIENCDINKLVVVDEETTRQVGSSIYLEVGDELKVIDLLYGMLLRSGNDAAYLLAISTCNKIDKFVFLMNETAKKAGMTSSTFTNPSGLDEDTCNYSTAYDMALLMAYALDNKTFRKIVSSKSYTTKTSEGKTFYFANKHRLVTSLDYVTGGKTGYTKRAKRTLVTSALKNGMELIVVTFNCGDDWNAHKKLFDYGFNNYEIKTILSKQIIEISEQYYNIVPYLPTDIKCPVREDEDVKCIIYLLKNPSGNVIGEARIYISGQEVIRREIYRF